MTDGRSLLLTERRWSRIIIKAKSLHLSSIAEHLRKWSRWFALHVSYHSLLATYSEFFSAFDFQPRCLFQGKAYHIINTIRHTYIHKKDTSRNVSAFNSKPWCLLQSSACHVVSNFIIWYDTKRITKLHSSGETCNQQRWWSLASVTPTPSLFLHVPCIPDQIRTFRLSTAMPPWGYSLSRDQ